MSGKLLATIAQVLTADAVDAMAAHAQIDRASARKAAELGVPALIGGLSELLAKKGLARLMRAIASQTLPGETAAMSVPGRSDGGSLLTFLFGFESADVLAAAIGRIVGAGERSTHAFLDALASRVLIVIAREDQAIAGGKGLAQLLRAEREPVATALPAGLSSALRANGFYEHLGRPAPATMPAAEPGSPTNTSLPARFGASRTGGYARWGYWALPLLTLFAGVWYFHAEALHRWVGSGGTDVAIPPWSELRTRLARTASQIEWIGDRGHDGDSRAGEGMGTLTDLVVGAATQVATALGIGEAPVAAPVADFEPRQENDGADERLGIDPVEPGLEAAPARPGARQRLHFVAPAFKDAIPTTGAALSEMPARSQAETQ